MTRIALAPFRIYPLRNGPELILIEDEANATILHHRDGMVHKCYSITIAGFNIRRQIRLLYSHPQVRNLFANFLLTS